MDRFQTCKAPRWMEKIKLHRQTPFIRTTRHTLMSAMGVKKSPRSNPEKPESSFFESISTRSGEIGRFFGMGTPEDSPTREANLLRPLNAYRKPEPSPGSKSDKVSKFFGESSGSGRNTSKSMETSFPSTSAGAGGKGRPGSLSVTPRRVAGSAPPSPPRRPKFVSQASQTPASMEKRKTMFRLPSCLRSKSSSRLDRPDAK